MIARAAAIALALAGSIPAASATGYGPEANYVLHCQGCHGANGASELPGAIPPLQQMGWFLGVPGGREYLAQVPGVAQAPIDDAQLAELLNYTVRRYAAATLAGPFRPYTTAEMARVRHGVEDIGGTRSSLVATIFDRLGVRAWTAQAGGAGSRPGGASAAAD
jgi:mono/diheme cytochrome c family protein